MNLYVIQSFRTKMEILDHHVYDVTRNRVTTVHPIEKVITKSLHFFEYLADAEANIINNTGDLSENGYYPFALIKKVPIGMWPTNFDVVKLFRFNDKKYCEYDIKRLPKEVYAKLVFTLS